ncbi:MAG: Mpo1-like protein [bacterium]|jgi:uncharacterized membrane protein YGL010W|nr:DUF962 domain-containing protein [Planctomycetota bacterium]HIL52288.1 DUF962 domain-containing protein [Planctomycetota bacterium]
MKLTLKRLFTEYQTCHQNRTNIAIHKLAIPAIVFHVVAMLDWLELGVFVAGVELSLAHVIMLPALLWYFIMAWHLGVVMLGYTAVCLGVGQVTAPWLVVTIAVAAWTMQLIGHACFERKAPAFGSNLIQLLVGPVYFLATSLGSWPEDGEA